MEKGVEVMITLRELSKKDGYMFTWKTALRAYSAVFGKHYWESAARREPGGRIATYIREHRHVVMTTYNLLRGQLKGGTLVRLHKGVYVFKDTTRIARPLYCVAGNYGGQFSRGRSLTSGRVF